MAKLTTRRPWYWTQFNPASKSAGAEIAQLRKGVGRPAGSVPELWRYYAVAISDYEAATGVMPPGLVAEHAALALFGVHQQSQSTSMHRPGEHIGTALRKLRSSPQFTANAEALDRRVNAAATATSVTELVFHLRGLITLLRGQQLPLDYTKLTEDIAAWHHPDGRAWVRRRWGASYYTWNATVDQAPAE
jgi:CRISPR type I-E-associated protein CasB/Cse2